jgi:hypothetical protein
MSLQRVVKDDKASANYAEVALIMSQCLKLRLCSLMNSSYSSVGVQDGSFNTVLHALQSDQLKFCQRLAITIVCMPTRTPDGKILDCLLETFLAGFADEEGLPTSTNELFMVSDVWHVLTLIFVKATNLLLASSSNTVSSTTSGTIHTSSACFVTTYHHVAMEDSPEVLSPEINRSLPSSTSTGNSSATKKKRVQFAEPQTIIKSSNSIFDNEGIDDADMIHMINGLQSSKDDDLTRKRRNQSKSAAVSSSYKQMGSMQEEEIEQEDHLDVNITSHKRISNKWNSHIVVLVSSHI